MMVTWAAAPPRSLSCDLVDGEPSDNGFGSEAEGEPGWVDLRRAGFGGEGDPACNALVADALVELSLLGEEASIVRGLIMHDLGGGRENTRFRFSPPLSRPSGDADCCCCCCTPESLEVRMQLQYTPLQRAHRYTGILVLAAIAPVAAFPFLFLSVTR
jgi:hypothetical protein